MISAVILTRNEEKNIKACLQHLQWCDEVAVIDGCSEDKTVAIARKLGAKVFRQPSGEDFAAWRNFGLEQVKGKWVFFIDADERVSPPLAKEIKEAVKKTDCQGFYLKRRDWFGGRWLKHGETANVRLLRLARKGSGRWEREVHEVWMVRGNRNELKNPLLHYPHPSINQFLNEIDFHSSLHAKALKEEGAKPSLLRILLNPLGKLLDNYFLKLGFLDGMPGLVVALMMSLHSFLARSKLYFEASKKQSRG